MNYNDRVNMEDSKVQETAREIASAMGWTYEPKEKWYATIKKDNLTLWFGRYDTRADKLEISGSLSGLQNHLPYNTKNPQINVTVGKGIKKIVADIERKILPDYTAIMEKATKNKRQFDENEAARHEIGKRLAKVFGVEYREDNKAVYVYDPYINIRIEFGSVKWEFSTSNEDASKVAEFLKSLRN